MQIVGQSVNIESLTDSPLRLIESAGRTCYRSQAATADPSAFINRLISSGHHSVLEHAVASLRIVTDRGVSHELVRHRLASYSQESTRYCNYSKDRFGGGLAVVRPWWVTSRTPEGPIVDVPAGIPTEEAAWFGAMLRAESTYLDLIRAGLTPEAARDVLPHSLKTELIMTANMREWRHVISIRTGADCHPQMRILAGMIRDAMHAAVPELFRDLMPPTCADCGQPIRIKDGEWIHDGQHQPRHPVRLR